MACKPEPVHLPVSCAHCGGAVELQCEYTTNRDTLIPAVYDCPCCGKRNNLRLSGRVLGAAKRDAKRGSDLSTRL